MFLKYVRIYLKKLIEFIAGMPLTLTCFGYGPQSKSMRGPWVQPRWGVRGDEALRQKKNVDIFFFL